MELREKLNVLIVLWFRCHLVTVASAFFSFLISENLEEKSSSSWGCDPSIKCSKAFKLGFIEFGFFKPWSNILFL